MRSIRRYRTASIWQALFLSALLIAIISLTALLYNVVDGAFGYVAFEYKNDPAKFTSTPMTELTKKELLAILKDNLSSGAYNKLDNEQPMEKRSQAELYTLFLERLVQMDTKGTWCMTDSLLRGDEIRAEVAKKYPDATLEFRSWLTPQFLITPMSSKAEFAGVRTAILGSLWLVGIAILFALPIGTGAAIYLQEYAPKNWLTSIIQTNINNLAGVPSIVYGMLGLAIFVRVMEPFTSGSMFGVTDCERAHHPFRWSDDGHPGPAADHHQRAGSHQSRARFAATGGVWRRRNPLADGLASCFAECPAWNFDGQHPGHLPCHGRNRPADRGGRFDLHQHGP